MPIPIGLGMYGSPQGTFSPDRLMAFGAGLTVYSLLLSVSGFSLVASQTVGILEGCTEILFFMGLNS
jgi:hypothetical protein